MPGVKGTNHRVQKTLTYNGKTQTLKQWTAELGLTRTVLYRRLRQGWEIERALSPADPRKRRPFKCECMNAN